MTTKTLEIEADQTESCEARGYHCGGGSRHCSGADGIRCTGYDPDLCPDRVRRYWELQEKNKVKFRGLTDIEVLGRLLFDRPIVY